MMSSSSFTKKSGDFKIFQLKEIALATNNFSDENLIRRGGFGKAYKGQLLDQSGQQIDIVARRLDPQYRQGKKEFLMEVSMLSALKHENLVSIIGYCDEKGEKIIINKHETHGSLDKYLTDPTLTWIQRLEICVGVARALSYIHYDKERDFSVIHRNIKSSKVLLDDNWKPKLSGFELSMKNTTARRHRLVLDRLSGTIGYIDPKYEKTGVVTHKSDIYSFGVVLFEVLCGRRAFNNPEWLSAQLEKEDVKEEEPAVVQALNEELDHEGPSQQSVKQGLIKGSSEVVEKEEGAVDHDGSSQQSAKQLFAEGSRDVVQNSDEMVNDEGRSPQLATQHSTEETRDVVRNASIIIGQKSPSSSNILPHMQQAPSIGSSLKWPRGLSSSDMAPNFSERFRPLPSTNNLSVGIPSPPLRNFSVVSRTASVSSLAGLNRSNNSSERFQPISSRDVRPNNFSSQNHPSSTKNLSGGIRSPTSRNFSVVSRTASVSSLAGINRSNNSSERFRPISSRDVRHSNFSGQNHPLSTKNLSTQMWPPPNFSSYESMPPNKAALHIHRSSTKNLSVGIQSPSSRKFSVVLRTASVSSLAGLNRSNSEPFQPPSIRRLSDTFPVSNFSEGNHPPSTRNLSGHVPQPLSVGAMLELEQRRMIRQIPSAGNLIQAPGSSIAKGPEEESAINLIQAPGSSIAKGPEEESNVYTQQQSALNPLDMCMFTLAPSARIHYEKRLGHLCIPEEQLLARLAISRYQEKKLYDLILPDLREKMDPLSLDIFSRIAYNCLKEQRSERPDIEDIVSRLQYALDIQRKHEKLHTVEEHSQNTAEVNSTSINNLKWENLDHLKIGINDIKVATEEFAKSHCIGSGTYGKVYKAELEHFDIQNSSKLQGQNTSDLRKISSMVAIKRISKRDDNQDEQGFSSEIKLLTSCNHRNVVSLLGFCDEESHMILVYEYVSKGSLDGCLRSNEIKSTLKWVDRLQICVDIAEGLQYLHTKNILHRDIKSDNILLDDNWVAKIADFGLSKIGPMSKQASDHQTNVAGTSVYLDPEYEKTYIVREASDIYSLGVVLFEIMSGRLAYDEEYMKIDVKGLAPVVREHSKNGTLKDMLDPKLKEEYDENIFTLSKGPNQDSLKTFLDIAYPCLADTHTQRPNIQTVVDQLKKALLLQKNHKDKLQISLEDIRLATKNFSDKNRIGRGGFGRVFKGEVTNAIGRHTNIAAKQLDTSGGQGETEFLTELEILLDYKHENVIGLVGYCNEPDAKIIVYEYAARGSLDRHLDNNDLTWMKRLGICIDIAKGLNFLHGGGVTKEVVMHRDIKSSNILLGDDWKAKISDFGLSLITSLNEDVIDNPCGTPGYCDPLYIKHRIFTKESDIYSLGVLLFEVLCGRLMYEGEGNNIIILIDEYKRYHKEGVLHLKVFKGIKGQIAPQSWTTFQSIALQCLHEKRERPTAGEVLLQLKKALEFQEDFDIWEPKLPNDYEAIFKMSNISDTDLPELKKDLYGMLSRGVLLQKRKVMFSLSNNGDRNEMISARKFLYKHRQLHMWPSLPKSRFHKVAQISNISNLEIQIKAQFLSLGVNYGVRLIFRFCGPTKSQAKQMYVNLKYKMGSESLNAYFAILREDGWMVIELFQFLNHKKDTCIEFVLESFSRCYCGSRAIYIEGIEFQAIEKIKHEETENSKEAQQVQISKVNMNQVQTKVEKLVWRFTQLSDESEKFSQNKVNKKKHYVLLANEALYESSDVQLDDSKPSAQSRFQDAIQLPQEQVLQVLRIKCKIESQRLSPNTKYACYLVFNLSEKSHGLNFPVIVRDLVKRKNRATRIIYFRTPSPYNVNDRDQVPEEREDGWREVNMWQFNSTNELREDCVSIHLKLISYEGTMSGLIVTSLEFRPM